MTAPDPTRAEGAREDADRALNKALDAADCEARALAYEAGIRWADAKRIADVYYGPAVRNDVVQMEALSARAARAEAEVARLKKESDEALCLAEGPSTLLELARGSVSRGFELHEAQAEVARLKVENERMRERCLKAAIGASYGPPSSWPGDYPRGWRHPPCWDEDRKPTPAEAAWHDNGARDAWFAIRALPVSGEGGGE